jgi:hypothetical protein
LRDYFGSEQSLTFDLLGGDRLDASRPADVPAASKRRPREAYRDRRIFPMYPTFMSRAAIARAESYFRSIAE